MTHTVNVTYRKLDQQQISQLEAIADGRSSDPVENQRVLARAALDLQDSVESLLGVMQAIEKARNSNRS